MPLSRAKSAPWSRPLGAIEKLFWLMDQNRPLHFVMAAEVEGFRSKEAWHAALNSTLQDIRTVRSQIVRDEHGQPVFIDGCDGDLDVRFVEGDPDQILPFIAGALSSAFDSDVGQLMRAIVLCDNHRAVLIIAVHHAIADGLALTFAISSVLRRLSGETVRVYQAAEAVECQVTRLQGGRPLPVTPLPAAQPENFRRFRGLCERVPHISRAVWPDGFVQTVHAQASSHAVTMHSALCAAFAEAYRSLTRERFRNLRIFTPLDVRKRLLHDSGLFGVAVTGAVTSSDSPLGTLWDEARTIEVQLSPLKQPKGTMALIGTTQALMENVVEVEQAASFMAANLGCDILMSNLGTIEPPDTHDGLTLRHLWGPAVTWGFENEQSLGFLSLRGELHFLHTSFSPAHGLLEKARVILEDAVLATKGGA